MGCKSKHPYNEIVANFCEADFWGYPEYLNAFSSLALSFFALYAVTTHRRLSSVLILFLTTVFWTGWGSFAYHWSGWNLWASLDVDPMFLAPWLAFFLTFNAVCYRHFQLNQKREGGYKWARVAIAQLTILPFFLTTSFRQNNGINLSITTYFVVPNLLTAVGVLIMGLGTHRDYFGSDSRLRSYLYLLVGMIGLALVFRVGLAEPRCLDHPELQKLFAHAWWHITIGYVFYLLTIILIYTHYLDLQYRPSFRRSIFGCGGESWCCQCWEVVDQIGAFLLPTIDFHAPMTGVV